MGEDSIFLLRDGDLVEMSARPYDTEEILQRYLEEHPKLLGGDQMDPEAPRRWIVVSREIAMTGEERGVGYVDHAFLDQDGIPTLVEVKRSSDTRIRREVVGQLLDYAANAVVHWPVETVRPLPTGRRQPDRNSGPGTRTASSSGSASISARTRSGRRARSTNGDFRRSLRCDGERGRSTAPSRSSSQRPPAHVRSWPSTPRAMLRSGLRP